MYTHYKKYAHCQKVKTCLFSDEETPTIIFDFVLFPRSASTSEFATRVCTFLQGHRNAVNDWNVYDIFIGVEVFDRNVFLFCTTLYGTIAHGLVDTIFRSLEIFIKQHSRKEYASMINIYFMCCISCTCRIFKSEKNESNGKDL